MAVPRPFAALGWLMAALLTSQLLSSTVSGGTVFTKKYSDLDPLRITYNPDPRSDLNEASCQQLSVTVSTTIRPSPQDRQLEIVLYAAGYGQPSIAYRQKIILPQGASATTESFVYIQPAGYSRWLLDVIEDGASILQPPPTVFSSNTTPKAGLHACCAVTASAAPDVGLPFAYDFSASDLFVDKISVANCPSDWRAYLRYSFVVLPIQFMDQVTVEQRQALSTYASSGGTIIVHVPSWQNDYRHDLVQVDRNFSFERAINTADYRWRSWPDTDGANGFQRFHGGGQIIALTDAPSNIHFHLAASGIHYPIGSMMNGGFTDEKWFWRNLIETVGKTPVWAFSGFVILFVFLVGPGLLFITGRLQHRTLLLFLIPACSLLLTTGILIYNLLRGGNTTRGRIVSIQYFDSHTGQGAAWSRQMYYCGFPPRNGLSFPKDVLLKPTDMTSDNHMWYDPRRRILAEICSEPDSLLVRRWLLPRSQQQILVGQPLKKTSLPFHVTNSSTDRILFTNSSEETLWLAALKGPKERFYLIEDVPAKATIELEPLTLSEVNSILRKDRDKWIPEIPQEIDPASPRSRRSRWNYGITVSETDGFQDILRMTAVVEKLPQYGYLVLSAHSSSIETPFPKTIFEGERNLHVLIGVNPW